MSLRIVVKKIGKRIYVERKKRRLSQEELAWESRLDRTYIARIEEGKANPSIKVLCKIARRLNLRVRELFH